MCTVFIDIDPPSFVFFLASRRFFITRFVCESRRCVSSGISRIVQTSSRRRVNPLGFCTFLSFPETRRFTLLCESEIRTASLVQLVDYISRSWKLVFQYYAQSGESKVLRTSVIALISKETGALCGFLFFFLKILISVVPNGYCFGEFRGYCKILVSRILEIHCMKGKDK